MMYTSLIYVCKQRVISCDIVGKIHNIQTRYCEDILMKVSIVMFISSIKDQTGGSEKDHDSIL